MRDRQRRARSRKILRKQSRRSWRRVSVANVAALPQRRVLNARRRRTSRKPLPNSRRRRRLRRRRPRVKRATKSNWSALEKIVGQKVHPYGFRLGYNKDWHSHWFAKRQFGEFLLEDLKLKRD